MDGQWSDISITHQQAACALWSTFDGWTFLSLMYQWTYVFKWLTVNDWLFKSLNSEHTLKRSMVEGKTFQSLTSEHNDGANELQEWELMKTWHMHSSGLLIIYCLVKILFNFNSYSTNHHDCKNFIPCYIFKLHPSLIIIMTNGYCYWETTQVFVMLNRVLVNFAVKCMFKSSFLDLVNY